MARQLGPHLSKSDGERPTETQHGDANEVCPLCEFETVDTDSIYIHLQTSHRKSQIAKEILADQSGR